MAENITNKERLQEITAGIEQGIKDLFQSDRYTQYLTTMSRFHNYSVNNQMLIYMQKPGATLVAGFNKWRDQFERHVKKGERGIKIIAPTPLKKKMEQEKIDPVTHIPLRGQDGKVITEEVEVQIPLFRPVTVFDVSQTDGKPLPQLAASLTGDVRQYEIFMEALRRSSPVPISMEAMAANTDGYFNLEGQRIALRTGMSEVQTVSAAVHEIAHAKLHNHEQARVDAAAGDESKQPPKPKDRATEEVEAESISFAVCAYYGIQTGENSFGYIAAWSKDKALPELRASLELINKTASGLITDIDRHFAELSKERGVDLTAPEQANQEQEALYSLDDTAYLHVQVSDDGYDYTLYDRQTWAALDGGQLDSPELSLTAARDEILALHELTPEQVEVASLDVLEEILAEVALPTTMPRRYGLDENGETQRLWNGKTPEQFNDQDMEAFVADTEAAISHAATTPAPAHLITLSARPEHGLDDYPMPDADLPVEALRRCHYHEDDMLPLSKERALELHQQDFAVYAIKDGSAEMLFDQEDFAAQEPGALFAMTRKEWESSPEFYGIVAARMNCQEAREAAFLQYPTDAFAIYQLKDDPALRDIRFESLKWLESRGASVVRENYELAYTSSFTKYAGMRNRLEELWDILNNNHPADYHRPSLSTSDIIAIKQNGKVICHYCDSTDFAELPGFLQPNNPLKNAEMAVEDDYGMIDGIINNGPKQPTVAELEAQVKAGQQISLLDLSRAVQAERGDKRKSVVEQLKQHQPQQERKKAAPAKGAEREI